MINGADFCVRLVDMPESIYGQTVEDEDGYYNVYINARQSQYRQLKAYLHELAHIIHNDFYPSGTAV